MENTKTNEGKQKENSDYDKKSYDDLIKEALSLIRVLFYLD